MVRPTTLHPVFVVQSDARLPLATIAVLLLVSVLQYQCALQSMVVWSIPTAVLVVQVTVLLQAPDCFVTRGTVDVLDHRVPLQTVARQMLRRVYVAARIVPRLLV